MLARLRDPAGGGLFFAPEDPLLPLRQKIAADAAVPAGNAVAAEVLIGLARAGAGERYRDEARAILAGLAGDVERSPLGCAGLPRGVAAPGGGVRGRLRAAALALSLALACLPPSAAGEVLLREEFASLDAWRPLTFPKIERHSTYAVAPGDEPGSTVLRAESDGSASGLVWKREWDVAAHPRLRWRWKVENVYAKGDATKKAGDDYPIRLYVIFPYDPSTAGAGKRLKYGAAKALYGEYPPDCGVSYVWESRETPGEFVPSPYTGSVVMFLREKGAARAGQWVEEEADVLADYRKAFGKDPPRAASLAVMNDSDNTGESSVSYVDWIEIGD